MNRLALSKVAQQSKQREPFPALGTVMRPEPVVFPVDVINEIAGRGGLKRTVFAFEGSMEVTYLLVKG